MNKKGLIIPAGVTIKEEGSSTQIGGNIADPAIIRNWVMFWDEFICPDNNFVSIGLSPDLEYLQQLNLLTRNSVPFQGSISSGDFSKLFLAAQEITYHEKNKENPGKWTMAQADGIITGNFNHKETEACIVFDLINSIHLPDRQVNLEDILEFKEKRRDELDSFHIYLEEIYNKIASTQDIIRTRNHEMQKLEKAISDYNKTVKEVFPNRLLTSLRIVLDRSLINSSGIALGAASLAPSLGLPSLDVGAFAGIAAFSIQNVLTGSPQKQNTHPLTYVSKIESKLF